jgi:hypothetical protein
MNDHFKRILDDAAAQLDSSLKDAETAVARAKKEMAGLAEFAERLPHDFLDKCNHLLVGEREFDGSSLYGSTYLSVGCNQIPLTPEIKLPLKGKYRVIMLIQKIG